jgi:pimeloyl-ACP methyl ester carboxylesterase
MYQAKRTCHSDFLDIRGLRYHVRVWEPVPAVDSAAAPITCFLLHGWMDVSASFQFLVDQLPSHWRFLAPDWRGYGLTQWSHADCYWFPDYLADLDALLDHYSPNDACRLIGHSMGGNVGALYSGIRPARVERLVNLDGLGLSPGDPEEAPTRYAHWLNEIKAGAVIRPFESEPAIAERLMKNNPRLRLAFAQFLARHWASADADELFRVRGDPAHKLVNPVLYRVEEVNACWRQIQSPVLWVFAQLNPRYQALMASADYQQRLSCIARLQRRTLPDSGHMMHHDQPEVLAGIITEFMDTKI